MNIDASLNQDDEYKDNFQIIMDVNIEVEAYFRLYVKAIGYFEIHTEASAEMSNIFINKNAPAIMFPYIRSFISTLTSNCGNSISTLIIPPQFFNGDLKRVNK